MAEPVRVTRRLVLRPWVEDDFADWSRHLNTADVRVHLGGVLSDKRAREVFGRLLSSWPDEGHGMLAVERRDDGALLGSCGCGPLMGETVPDEMRGGFEVGYQLRTDARGHGYAAEAAKAVLQMIFDRGHDVAWGQTSEANVASGRVLQRLGMERRPDLDYDDAAYPAHENPTQVWAITREDAA